MFVCFSFALVFHFNRLQYNYFVDQVFSKDNQIYRGKDVFNVALSITQRNAESEGPVLFDQNGPI